MAWHDLGGHGVADSCPSCRKHLPAVRAGDEVVLVVLAGVDQQGVALEAELGAVLNTCLALAAEVEVEAIVAGIGAAGMATRGVSMTCNK